MEIWSKKKIGFHPRGSDFSVAQHLSPLSMHQILKRIHFNLKMIFIQIIITNNKIAQVVKVEFWVELGLLPA